MAAPSLEERVAALEAEIRQLKQQKEAAPDANSRPWWEKIVGVHQDDPAFDEAERLGREYRESMRPNDDEIGTERLF